MLNLKNGKSLLLVHFLGGKSGLFCLTPGKLLQDVESVHGLCFQGIQSQRQTKIENV